jgi:uncharacterized protein
MAQVLEAFFQPSAQGGQRLYLHHVPPPGTPVRGAVLYVHPWAEEMNKSRRMAGLASRQLAAAGHAVLQVDLLGCGDSSGEFGDATWAAWIDDLDEAAQWLQARHPGAPLWLWGLRVGALLATALAQRRQDALNFLFWQPSLQGKTAWQQFLRLKAAAQLADGGGKAILDAARAELAAGRAIEVAGYCVQPALTRGLEAATLVVPEVQASVATTGSGQNRVVWLEVSNQDEPTASPAATSAAPRWQQAGWATELRAVRGPAFWQTTEIEDAPALLSSTLEALAA